MSRDLDFRNRWDADKPVYQAFASYVVDQFRLKLAPIVNPVDVDYFLRTAVKPRLKDDDGLVAKAFYRGKNYRDPYTEITDKVGVRFVVLLGRDIEYAEKALREIGGLEFSKDRDYEEEQSKNPISFDYAAVHYVVKASVDFEHDGAKIPAGTPCEVQMKTLLQHAYSELTHDTIYKPQIEATTEMKRDAAKSMALLEATNDYFEKVFDRVTSVIESLSEVTKALSGIYRERVGFPAEPTLLEGLILEGYGSLAKGDFLSDVNSLAGEKPFLADRIKERVADGNPLFKQPSVWLVYLDILRRGTRAAELWKFTPAELEPFMNDLGESIS